MLVANVGGLIKRLSVVESYCVVDVLWMTLLYCINVFGDLVYVLS